MFCDRLGARANLIDDTAQDGAMRVPQAAKQNARVDRGGEMATLSLLEAITWRMQQVGMTARGLQPAIGGLTASTMCYRASAVFAYRRPASCTRSSARHGPFCTPIDKMASVHRSPKRWTLRLRQRRAKPVRGYAR